MSTRIEVSYLKPEPPQRTVRGLALLERRGACCGPGAGLSRQGAASDLGGAVRDHFPLTAVAAVSIAAHIIEGERMSQVA